MRAWRKMVRVEAVMRRQRPDNGWIGRAETPDSRGKERSPRHPIFHGEWLYSDGDTPHQRALTGALLMVSTELLHRVPRARILRLIADAVARLISEPPKGRAPVSGGFGAAPHPVFVEGSGREVYPCQGRGV